MSLLDTVIGALGQGQPGPGGGQGDLVTAIVGMLGQQGVGGLSGLVDKLQQAGLGDAVNSWVGTGQNQPVAPDQLGQALGPDVIAGFARQLGLNSQDALGPLAQLLPQVVDKLTPGGQLPPAGSSGLDALARQAGLGDLEGALGGLFGRR